MWRSAPFGHAREKGAEFKWALPGGVEGSDGALLMQCCRCAEVFGSGAGCWAS